MPVKFNQYWTIISEQRSEYGKHMVKKFIPGMNALGIHVVAGWMGLIGGYSEIFVEGMGNDLDLIEQALRNPKFAKIKDELMRYIKSYKTKILIPTGKKDAYSPEYEEGMIKYNQTWNVISQTRKDYERFVVEEYYPLLEASEIVVAGEWEVLIGDGPHIICEGRVRDSSTLIGNIMTKQFRTARRKLKGYVENYESRIFSPHIRKVHGYKSSSYHMLEV